MNQSKKFQRRLDELNEQLSTIGTIDEINTNIQKHQAQIELLQQTIHYAKLTNQLQQIRITIIRNYKSVKTI